MAADRDTELDRDFERRRQALENAFDQNGLRALVKAHELTVGDGPTKNELLDTLAAADVTIPGYDDTDDRSAAPATRRHTRATPPVVDGVDGGFEHVDHDYVKTRAMNNRQPAVISFSPSYGD